MGRFAALCVAFVGVSFAGVASAEEPSPDVFDQARVLYEEGANAYQAGRYLQAEMNFRRVHNLLHAPSVLFDLALAQEKQKKWGEAAANFEIFMRDSKLVANRERLEKRVERLRDLERRSRKGPGAATGPEPPPPGEELQLDSGETAPPASVEVPPQPPGAAPPAGAPPAPAAAATPAGQSAPVPGTPVPAGPEKSKSRWWVWAVVGGVAVAAIAIGVGVGLSAKGGPEPGTATDFDFTYGALSSSGLAVGAAPAPLVRF